MARINSLYDAVIAGNRKSTVQMVEQNLNVGFDPTDLLEQTMIPAMKEVGFRFSRGEIYVPEMLIAARAMQAGLDLLEPILARTGARTQAKVAIGTVKGDLHDIGKNLVAIMLKGAGIEVEDLGVDCAVEKFAGAVDRGFTTLCLSALLTTTMPSMKSVVERFRDRPDVKIVVGGAPVTREFAQEIGADAFGEDANEAVQIVERLLVPEKQS